MQGGQRIEPLALLPAEALLPTGTRGSPGEDHSSATAYKKYDEMRWVRIAVMVAPGYLPRIAQAHTILCDGRPNQNHRRAYGGTYNGLKIGRSRVGSSTTAVDRPFPASPEPSGGRRATVSAQKISAPGSTIGEVAGANMMRSSSRRHPGGYLTPPKHPHGTMPSRSRCSSRIEYTTVWDDECQGDLSV